MLTRSKKKLHYDNFWETERQTGNQLTSEEEAHRDNIGEVSQLIRLVDESFK